jgi:hypothetical protein
MRSNNPDLAIVKFLIRNNSFYIYSSNKHVFFLVLLYNNNLYWDVDNQLLGRY